MKHYNPPTLWEVPETFRPIYSHGVETASAGRTLHLAGQLGIDLEGRVAQDLDRQCEQAMKNVEALLSSADMTLANVVRATYYVVGKPALGALLRARRSRWAGVAPAVTTLLVPGLARDDCSVEIEVVAHAARVAGTQSLGSEKRSRVSSFQDSSLGQLRTLVGSIPLVVSGVRVVVQRHDGCVLLQQRADFGGSWGLPGGILEFGEDASAGARREVQEETGLRLGKLTAFGHFSDPQVEVVVFPNGDICHFHTVAFLAEEFTGELLVASTETSGLQWCRLDQCAALPMLPNMLATIQALTRFRRTGVFQVH